MNRQQYLMERAKEKLPTVQARFDDKQIEKYFAFLTDWCQPKDSLGVIGSDSRDLKLRTIWTQEPILAGLMYTQQARLAAMHWTIKGPEQPSLDYTKMFQNMGFGIGYDTEIKKWAQDYTDQSRGALLEKSTQGEVGPVLMLSHLDFSKCYLTGNPLAPVVYTDNFGKEHQLDARHVIHKCSMPGSVESARGAGCCLVDRAMRAVQLLMALNKYEESSLDDMPPDGIAQVTGMDWQSLERAMGLWQQRKDSKDLTFKRVLWLCGNPMSTQALHVEFTPFAQLPKEFNQREVVESYVKTLALCAGEDPNEFWLFVHTGATKGIGALLHEKGQGKGVVEMATVLERSFNSEVLPEGLSFQYDYRDRSAQKMELQRQDSAITNILNMWKPPMGMTVGMIPLEVGLDLLVQHEVLTQKQAQMAMAAAPEPAALADNRVGSDRQGTTNTPETKELTILLEDRLSDIRKDIKELQEEVETE